MDVKSLLDTARSAIDKFRTSWGATIAQRLLQRFPLKKTEDGYAITLEEEVANRVLTMANVQGVAIRFLPGAIVVEVDRFHLLIRARLSLEGWRIDSTRARFDFKALAPLEKEGKDLVGRVVLGVLSLVFGRDIDYKLFWSQAAQMPGVSWHGDLLRCDLDQIPEVHKYLRYSFLGFQLLDILDVSKVELQEAALTVVLNVAEKWKELFRRAKLIPPP